VFRNDVIGKNPDAVRAFVTGVAKALQWEHDTPHDQVIAKFAQIVEARHRPGETTDTLKYWLSSGEPVPYGVISAGDFTRWQSWLQDTGAISGPLDASKFYTNKFNPYVTQVVSTPQPGRRGAAVTGRSLFSPESSNEPLPSWCSCW
jgi:ABC-type nitrate/sulfonate/bicarbonate transport system substrate-binding protein